jgi:hypothetical protein
LDFLTVAIRNLDDSGSLSIMASPLALLVAALDRLGHYECALHHQWTRGHPRHASELTDRNRRFWRWHAAD